MSKGLIAPLAIAMTLAGCSTAGYQFALPPGTAAEATPQVGAYSVERITPAVLSSMRTLMTAPDTPIVSLSLQQAINNYQYRVGPHDVLNVVVWNHPELTLSQAASIPLGSLTGSYLVTPPSSTGSGFEVDTKGNIFFPYAGTLNVAAETVDQIRQQLEHALGQYSNNPQVSVSVTGFMSERYQLAGAVLRPGVYPLTNVPITVSQAIASAGGEIRSLPTSASGTITDITSLPLADLSHVSLISGGRREVLDLRRYYEFGDETQDRLVRPGDIIQVPDNTDEYVHVIGEVARQGNYPLNNGRLNLAQALGNAGGISLTTSDPARIFVFREISGKPNVYWLDARSADAMLLATQFDLASQDVVYVATNALATWNRVIAQILPTVQTLYETKILVHP